MVGGEGSLVIGSSFFGGLLEVDVYKCRKNHDIVVNAMAATDVTTSD
jgi:hypothetical protein